MPRLLIKQGLGVGRDHTLGAAPCEVGRDPGVDFVLDDASTSRRHFRVYQEQGAYFMEDLGSTNGTRVNGRRSKHIQLEDGDLIELGATQITFVQKALLGGAAVRPRAVSKPRVVNDALDRDAADRDAADRDAAETGAQAPVRRRRRR